MNQFNRIIAVVPCFNEEGRIGDTLARLIPQVDLVLVIDDGSTDNTLAEIKKFDVQVLTYRKNKGKGYAIRKGIEYFLQSDFDIVVFMDGDGQHSPENIVNFKEAFSQDVDVVVASRFGTEEWVNNMPFLRKISNLLSRFGIWILFNKFIVEDPQNGFRAYRREVLENIEFFTNGYEAETEILIDAYLKGYKFDKVLIKSIYNNVDNHSKFSLFTDTWKIPKIMLEGFFKKKPFLYRTQMKKINYRQKRKN